MMLFQVQRHISSEFFIFQQDSASARTQALQAINFLYP